ncbi:MAG: hypothetical protein ACIAZJ_23690 [Gimesia chilikensis]|uniref:hypothetical protein n=1 Tax=Gimesia chilikensis TaxID=2605989 RepID=UPI0037AC0C82
MAWPELSIEDFPPRRDDEPSSLRQDIIDELSDHFACALNRELLKNPNEKIARQRVLNQFGDPIKIARQLWLEAMKERIMSQRILTGVSVVMAVCGFIVVGLVWSMMKESQAFNSRMMAQMEEFADRPVPEARTDSATGEMNQVSFQLFQGKTGGKPAVGFEGKLTKIGDNTDSFTLTEKSNAEGKLDFGNLPWGGYSLNVTAPWGEAYHKSLTVLPGRNYSQSIVCPAAAPVEVPVRFEVQWLEELKSDDWLLLCDFRPRSIDRGTSALSRNIGTELWTRPYPNPLDGTWDYPMVCLINHENQVFRCPLDQNRMFQNIDYDKLKARQTINMIEGDQYFLPVMYLLRKKELVHLPDLESDSPFSILNSKRTQLSLFNPVRINLSNSNFGGPANYKPTRLIVPFGMSASVTGLVEDGAATSYARGIQLPELLKFTAAPDRKNVWKIDLPKLNQLVVPEGVETVNENGSGRGFF